jgi:hypothetical protein
MKNPKNIIIAILVIIVFVLGYMLMVSFPNKAKAECEAVVIEQVTNATQQCVVGAQQCQQVIQQLMQVPACASALSQ